MRLASSNDMKYVVQNLIRTESPQLLQKDLPKSYEFLIPYLMFTEKEHAAAMQAASAQSIIETSTSLVPLHSTPLADQSIASKTTF
jgi:hypothetical protein